MNTISRVQSILRSEAPKNDSSPWRAVRVEVENSHGPNLPRVTLSPGDRLVVVNHTNSKLIVSPMDFFGNSFGATVLEPHECGPALLVSGLWFQVELRDETRRSFPLDVYLAPNEAV